MRRRAIEAERGGILVGWVVKLVVSLAIVGLAAFEAGAVLVAHVTADTAVNEVAGEAAFVVARGGTARAAEDAAREEAGKRGVELIEFSVAPDREHVSVTIEKRAKTLLLHRLSWTKSWTIVRTDLRRPATT